ncbi:MAG: MASE1 domain-containing protein [Anaerolineales bacterium]|nr:MASE1 domain-containing protein [Anaerolineales bacterium]NUQ84475.1 MASE1 domain-containing protein [Anaerolineales bacterium]
MKFLSLVRSRNAKAAAIYLLKILVLAVIYHLAARVGLKMAYVQFNTSPVWPPTGIALAALLVFGFNVWPGISLGVLFGSLLTGADPAIAVGLTIGNTLEALTGAYLLKRFIGFHNAMDRIRDAVGLAAVSVFSTTISATIGTFTLMLTGSAEWSGFGAIWTTWWIGDLLGALVVAPALLVWAKPPSLRSRSRQYLEGVVLLVLLVFVTRYVFGSEPPDGIFHQTLIYLLFPFTIWAALRLEQHGATLAIFVVSGIAIWGTVQGLGPFGSPK